MFPDENPASVGTHVCLLREGKEPLLPLYSVWWLLGRGVLGCLPKIGVLKSEPKYLNIEALGTTERLHI